MSFHSTLTATAVWPTDLVSVVTMLASTDQVYTGRRPRSPQDTRGEVWIERLPTEEQGPGTTRVVAHPYLLHVYSGVRNAGPDKTGDAQLDTTEAAVQEIVDAYDGQRRLAASLSSLITWTAADDSQDQDPQDRKTNEATVRVTVYATE